MSIEFDNLIEECNSKRSNIYYRLNQLIDITGLCPRMLKYRMKEIKQRYKNIPSLLRKEGRCWKIHISIVNEFLPKRNRKGRTLFTHRWESFATWNTKCSYDLAYHLELIEQVYSKIKPYKIKFTIEEDGRGTKHVHFISDANKSELTDAITVVLDKYLSKKEYKLEVNNINNKHSAVQYIGKSPLASGLI